MVQKPGEPEADSRELDDAYHEAGHAVLAIMRGFPVHKVAVVADAAQNRAGFTDMDTTARDVSHESVPEHQKWWKWENEMLRLLGGLAVDKLRNRSGIDHRQTSDWSEVRAGAEGLCHSDEAEANAFLEWLLIRAQNELKGHAWRQVEEVARAVFEHPEKTLTEQEVERCIQRCVDSETRELKRQIPMNVCRGVDLCRE